MVRCESYEEREGSAAGHSEHSVGRHPRTAGDDASPSLPELAPRCLPAALPAKALKVPDSVGGVDQDSLGEPKRGGTPVWREFERPLCVRDQAGEGHAHEQRCCREEVLGTTTPSKPQQRGRSRPVDSVPRMEGGGGRRGGGGGGEGGGEEGIR